MPIEVRGASAPVSGHSRTPSISPLLIAATLALVMLHLAVGVTLARSHPSPTVEPPTKAALDDGATCSTDVSKPETSLPYD
jgi:hypothetical protein